ncbi:MAG: radical SAM/SPASM domain-containing protein [Marinilabiliales bacterium]|nr:MAG: radical SAM/SPASM domain-containing protein [Marinilabiliales bacterium]
MPLPLKQKIVRNVFSKYARTQAQIHPLTYLFWECTLRCNLNCLHCGSDCKKESNVKDMPIEDFTKVLKEISTKYEPGKVMIVLTGGEPMVRKDLEECGREITKLGFPSGMVTNGMMLTQERINSLIASGLRSITLSVDGLEDNHNWLRGSKKSFAAVKNALKVIASQKNLVHDVVTCVNKRNLSELDQIKQLLIDSGIQAWRLFTIAPIGRAVEYPDLHLDGKEIRQLFEYIEESRKTTEIETSFSCEAYAGEYDHKIRNGLFFCRAGVNIGSVLADGSVSACPNNSYEFVQGNIYKESFLDIWENKLRNMRNRSWMKTGICKNCKEFKYCNGGAMHLRGNNQSEILRCLWHEMDKD